MMESIQIQIFRALLVLALLTVALLAFMQMPEMGPQRVSDKLNHACAFYALALLLDFARPQTGFGVRKFAVLMAYGVAIEFVQDFLPWREFSLLDMVADAVGLLLYIASIPLLMRLPLLRRRWQ